MQFLIGVKDFGKIENAEIDISNYTLLVGQNNSGKSYMMQLIIGVCEYISECFNIEMGKKLALIEKEQGYDKVILDNDSMCTIFGFLNEKLEEEKEKIVKRIFGREIQIEKLYVKMFLDENETYQIRFYKKNENSNIKDAAIFLNDDLKKIYEKLESGLLTGVIKNDEKKLEFAQLHFGFSESTEIVSLGSVIESILGYRSSDMLFLPAARTGLLALYREFFANKADDAMMIQKGDELEIRQSQKPLGLTEPVYRFLRFLQTHAESDYRKDRFEQELDFFDKRIIDGHVEYNPQGLANYQSNENNESIPIYLASSMINEVIPIAWAITDERFYSRLIIDEVEASLHPQKQLELVKFLNRINNRGMKLVISTHSDTFVSKLNNLFLVSKYIARNKDQMDILDKLQLEKEDLTNLGDLSVYQFTNQKNGKSIVTEIVPDDKWGYQFDLFTESVVNLYDEAQMLMENEND